MANQSATPNHKVRQVEEPNISSIINKTLIQISWNKIENKTCKLVTPKISRSHFNQMRVNRQDLAVVKDNC